MAAGSSVIRLAQSATPEVNKVYIPRDIERVSPLRRVLTAWGKKTHRGERSSEIADQFSFHAENVTSGVRTLIRRPVNGCAKPRALACRRIEPLDCSP